MSKFFNGFMGRLLCGNVLAHKWFENASGTLTCRRCWKIFDPIRQCAKNIGDNLDEMDKELISLSKRERIDELETLLEKSDYAIKDFGPNLVSCEVIEDRIKELKSQTLTGGEVDK